MSANVITSGGASETDAMVLGRSVGGGERNGGSLLTLRPSEDFFLRIG
jgi:hypothetical protein